MLTAAAERELHELQKERAFPLTAEDRLRIKMGMQVTAATTDLFAAALVALELYAQSNKWPLRHLDPDTKKRAACADGRGVREMLGNLSARLSPS